MVTLRAYTLHLTKLNDRVNRHVVYVQRINKFDSKGQSSSPQDKNVPF